MHRTRHRAARRTAPLLSIAALASLILAGCAHRSHCPTIPGGPAYCLQGTDAVAPFSALQDLRIRRGELDERMIARLEVDTAGMRLAGLTPMGQKVFDATFDNRDATANSIAGDRLDVRAMLALVQLATWPRERVEAALPTPYRVEDSADRRRLLREDTTVVDILRKGPPPAYKVLEITLPAADLVVVIETIDEEN